MRSSCARISKAVSFARSNLARAGQKVQYDWSHRKLTEDVGDLAVRRMSGTTKGFPVGQVVGPVGTKLPPLVYQLTDSYGRSVGSPVNFADLKPFTARRDDLEGGEEQPTPPSNTKWGEQDQLPRSHRLRTAKP